MDSKADDQEAFSPETVTAKSPIAVAAPASTLHQHGSPKPAALLPDAHKKSLQPAAAVEDTRVIPARPVAPFTATKASDEFLQEEDGDLSLSTTPQQELVSV